MNEKMPWYQHVAIERFAPITMGCAFALAAYAFRYSLSVEFATKHFDSAALYNAVFGWASVQTGFVFGVYVFIATKTDGFVKHISKDQPFHRFTKYIRRATAAGFILTFITIPMIILSPELVAPNSISYYICCIWFGMFIWAIFTFLRVSVIFGRIVTVEDRPVSIPG